MTDVPALLSRIKRHCSHLAGWPSRADVKALLGLYEKLVARNLEQEREVNRLSREWHDSIQRNVRMQMDAAEREANLELEAKHWKAQSDAYFAKLCEIANLKPVPPAYLDKVSDRDNFKASPEKFVVKRYEDWPEVNIPRSVDKSEN
jgi:hypothetical protein